MSTPTIIDMYVHWRAERHNSQKVTEARAAYARMIAAGVAENDIEAVMELAKHYGAETEYDSSCGSEL